MVDPINDRMEEHDALLRQFRRAYEMSSSFHNRMAEQSESHLQMESSLEERLHDLRRQMGLPREDVLHTLRTQAEIMAGFDATNLDDVLCDRNQPWEDYGNDAIRRCVRNDAIVEIIFRAGQLKQCMPENAPDQDRLDRLHRALTDAATTMQAALKPYADPVV